MRTEAEKDAVGQRAEEVATFYFRLNGFLSIPGFIVHPDEIDRNPLTEADILGVRFPHSRELIMKDFMTDDPAITSELAAENQTLFVLVEVKATWPDINYAWTEKDLKVMHRAIRRLGFVQENEIKEVASSIYDCSRWENDNYVLQQVCVGKEKIQALQRIHSRLAQITWEQISDFLNARFSAFPEKLPHKFAHKQWPGFGQEYARMHKSGKDSNRQISLEQSYGVVMRYIDTGNLDTNAW